MFIYRDASIDIEQNVQDLNVDVDDTEATQDVSIDSDSNTDEEKASLQM